MKWDQSYPILVILDKNIRKIDYGERSIDNYF